MRKKINNTDQCNDFEEILRSPHFKVKGEEMDNDCTNRFGDTKIKDFNNWLRAVTHRRSNPG